MRLVIGVFTPRKDDSPVTQALDDSEAGAVEPGFDGTDGFAHHGANRFVGHLFGMEEYKDFTVFCSELVNSGVDLLLQFAGPFRWDFSARIAVEQRAEAGSSGALGQCGSAAVDRDTQNPGLKRPLLIPGMEAAEDANERLLGQVFGLVGVSHESATNPIDIVLEAFDHVFKGHRIFGLAGPHQHPF